MVVAVISVMNHFKEELQECLAGRDSLHISFDQAARLLHSSEGQSLKALAEMPGTLIVDTSLHGDGQFFFDETRTRVALCLTLIKVGSRSCAFSILCLQSA